MFNNIKEKYLNIRYKLYCWWNPVEYYRLPLPDHEKGLQIRSALTFSGGEVFGGYIVEDVTEKHSNYILFPSGLAGKLSDATKKPEIIDEIEIKLNQLYCKYSFKYAEPFGLCDHIKKEAINALREEIDTKRWTRLFVSGGIRTEVYREIYIYWKLWQKWVNWIFGNTIINPREKKKYTVEYRIRIGGYNEKNCCTINPTTRNYRPGFN